MAPGVPVHGKVVLITGAARGIGAATARRLAARGARVALVGLEPQLLRGVAADIGDAAIALDADVRDEAAMRAAARTTVDHFGRLDIVVANAGVAYGAATDTISDAEERTTVEVNVLGVMRTVRATLGQVAAARGQYVIVASLAAAVQLPLLAAYSASKAAVAAYGNSLRLELRQRGVDVSVAYFGFIDTDMGRLAGDSHAMTMMTAAAPGPMGRLLPVGAAVDALIDGIERRRRRIVAPRFLLPAILMPGPAQAIIERAVRRAIPAALSVARGELTPGHRHSTPGLVPQETAAATTSTG